MKQNLLVISYDYDLSKRLAERLADVFSMRVFDQIEFIKNAIANAESTEIDKDKLADKLTSVLIKMLEYRE